LKLFNALGVRAMRARIPAAISLERRRRRIITWRMKKEQANTERGGGEDESGDL